MEQQPVNLEEEAKREREKQIEYFGNRVENNVYNGAEVIIEETERVWFGNILEKRGVVFYVLEEGKCELGAAGRSVNTEQCDKGYTLVGGEKIKCSTLVAQTAFVDAMLGREEMIRVVSRVMVDTMETRSGKVFKGKYLSTHPEEMPDSGEGQIMVTKFVGDFLNNGLDDQEHALVYSPKRALNDGKYVVENEEEEATDGEPTADDWKKNAMYRIEAIVSGIYRVAKILNADSQEAAAVQADKYTLWHLRERVLRGMEEESKVKDVDDEGNEVYRQTLHVRSEVPRHSKDSKLRPLASGALRQILIHLSDTERI